MSNGELQLTKNKFLFLLCLFCFVLIIYSWFLSYPVLINSSDDFIYNHISPYYWISLLLLYLISYIIGITSKNKFLNLINVLIVVISTYSIVYFYSFLPGSDSHFIRGMMEYFLEKGSLKPIFPTHVYFQWPLFFILNRIIIFLTGFKLIQCEFLVYTLFIFLIFTSIYSYVFNLFKNSSYISIISFIIIIYNFINIQYVPYTLALCILLLMFMIESIIIESLEKKLILIILFIFISYTHVIIPMFFILYEFFKNNIRIQEKKSIKHTLLYTVLYLSILIFQANFSFKRIIYVIMSTSSGYIKIIETTTQKTTILFDIIPQIIRRSIVISTFIICFSGFIIFIIRGKIRPIDKAIFISGLIYSALGFFINILGQRAWVIAFLPISLGASYLYITKFRPYIKLSYLILIILFIFIPIGKTLYWRNITFQTIEAYKAENFVIDHYDWNNRNRILAHYRVARYFTSRLIHYIESEYTNYFWLEGIAQKRINNYDSIFHTVGLEKILLRYNYTIERILHEEKFSSVYNNGFSYLMIKP